MASTTENDETIVTYRGACHCRAFKFTLDAPRIKTVAYCNCSLCTRGGGLWTLPPKSEDFKFTKGGYDDLKGYSWTGIRTIYHCPTCGTILFRKQAPELLGGEFAVNVRAFDDIDVWDLDIFYFDGRTQMPGEWKVTSFEEELPIDGPENGKVYTGACHCGAVTLAVKTGDINAGEVDVKEDNCSICTRNGNVLIYPHSSHVSVQGEENLTEYRFGTKRVGHYFCKNCGTNMYIRVHGPSKDEFEELPAAQQQFWTSFTGIVPLRLAVLEGVDIAKLKIERRHPGKEGYVAD